METLGSSTLHYKRDTYPLLSISVFQIVIGLVIPIDSDPQQCVGQETVFSQNDKICEESCQGLDHT